MCELFIYLEWLQGCKINPENKLHNNTNFKKTDKNQNQYDVFT